MRRKKEGHQIRLLRKKTDRTENRRKEITTVDEGKGETEKHARSKEKREGAKKKEKEEESVWWECCTCQ